MASTGAASESNVKEDVVVRALCRPWVPSSSSSDKYIGGRPKRVYPKSVRENLGRLRCLALRRGEAPMLECNDRASESVSLKRRSRSFEPGVLEREMGVLEDCPVVFEDEAAVKHEQHEANAARMPSL